MTYTFEQWMDRMLHAFDFDRSDILPINLTDLRADLIADRDRLNREIETLRAEKQQKQMACDSYKRDYQAAEAARDKLAQRVKVLSDLYYDLLFSVVHKFPGETRHQTAKRYIVEIETAKPVKARAALEEKP